MRVLIACEKSQEVCKAFRAKGHEAFSCDILPVDIFSHKEWHLEGDAVAAAYTKHWDLMIAHPPCPKMANCSARWMYKGGELQPKRLAEAMEAKSFFMKLLNAPIPLIALENPTPLKIVGLPECTQVIQPYQFGDPFSKRTLLWLKGLPSLIPTNILTEYKPFLQSGGQNAELSKVRGAARSKTFTGIALAMAEQWG